MTVTSLNAQASSDSCWSTPLSNRSLIEPEHGTYTVVSSKQTSWSRWPFHGFGKSECPRSQPPMSQSPAKAQLDDADHTSVPSISSRSTS